MNLTPMTFLIVCPLVFLAGFVDSIAGGGGLISLPAFLMSGLPAHYAIGTNKLSSCCGTTISTIRYFKNGSVVKELILPSVISSLIGSALGSRLVLMVDEKWIRYLLVVVLPVCAILLFVKKDTLATKEALPKRSRRIRVIIIALLVGAYDGFYGPGTGTFLALLLTGVAHLEIREATGNAKCMNLASNAAALTTFLINGNVVVSLGLACAACNMLGNYFGSGLALKKGVGIIRPLMLVVMVLLLLKVLFG